MSNALATDLARIHASMVLIEEENDGEIEPDWLNLYGVETADMSVPLYLASKGESIPRILEAYIEALEQPLHEARAKYEGLAKDEENNGRFGRTRLAKMRVQGWERKQQELHIDPETGTIQFHQDRGAAITLRWEAPGKVTVVDMNDHHFGFHLAWWLLLTTRDAARDMMRAKINHPDVKSDGYWSDFAILKSGPRELDWIVCIDDYCQLGGRALAWAEQNMTQWAPNMEITRPRRVREYHLNQAAKMWAVNITPVLALPSTNVVVVASKEDVEEQGVEYEEFPEEALTEDLRGRYETWRRCSDLTEEIRGWGFFGGQGWGSARYSRDYVTKYDGPKTKVRIFEGRRYHGDPIKREFYEEFPDMFSRGWILARYAYPGAQVSSN